MGKEIGASYLPARPISQALRLLQYRSFPIRQVVGIQGDFGVLSSSAILFLLHTTLLMSTSDVESGTDLQSSSNSALPDQERHTKRVVTGDGIREFLIINGDAR